MRAATGNEAGQSQRRFLYQQISRSELPVRRALDLGLSRHQKQTVALSQILLMLVKLQYRPRHRYIIKL